MRPAVRVPPELKAGRDDFPRLRDFLVERFLQAEESAELLLRRLVVPQPQPGVGRLVVRSYGEVYRVRDTRLGRDVAVKVLPDHLSRDAAVAAQAPVRIRMGTLAPQGTSYQRILQTMGERWRTARSTASWRSPSRSRSACPPTNGWTR